MISFFDIILGCAGCDDSCECNVSDSRDSACNKGETDSNNSEIQVLGS